MKILKNKKYQRCKNNLKLDYSNLKETLKEYKDAYKECEDDESKYNIIMNYNNTLEEFIDLFEKNFDNETIIEKYYLYL